jgi:hypothetical protein
MLCTKADEGLPVAPLRRFAASIGNTDSGLFGTPTTDTALFEARNTSNERVFACQKQLAFFLFAATKSSCRF